MYNARQHGSALLFRVAEYRRRSGKEVREGAAEQTDGNNDKRRKAIKKNFKEIYYERQGYRIFNTYLIGINPIPVAVDNDYIIMPYVKPCHGSFVLRIKGKAEVERLRAGGI